MGAVVGLTGASGVMVIIPAMTLLLDVPIELAIGTSLMANVFATTCISGFHIYERNVSWKPVALLGLGTLPGAFFGADNIQLVPTWALTIGIALFLIAMGIKLLRDGGTQPVRSPQANTEELPFTPMVCVLLLLSGGFLGAMAGLFGATGGLLVFAMLYLWLKKSLMKSIGTSTVLMVFVAVAGSIMHTIHDNILFETSAYIGIPAALVGFISIKHASHWSGKVFSTVVGITFFLLGAAMLVVRILN